MKMYLLLRNNVESGPYNVDSLKKKNLEKFDLIWIENESITWKYPSEIKEFKNFAPAVEVTYGTIVNNLKEKQIKYFRDYNIELDYKKINLSYINEPDAFVSDVPEGYEYLVLADAANRYGGSMHVSAETTNTDYNNAHEPVDYNVLGEKQKINTAEVIADHQQFTTTIHIKKKAKAQPPVVAMPVKEKKKILFKIAGLSIFAASLFGHLKL